MEAARTSETSVDIQLRTRQYIPEDSELGSLFCLSTTRNALSNYLYGFTYRSQSEKFVRLARHEYDEERDHDLAGWLMEGRRRANFRRREILFQHTPASETWPPPWSPDTLQGKEQGDGGRKIPPRKIELPPIPGAIKRSQSYYNHVSSIELLGTEIRQQYSKYRDISGTRSSLESEDWVHSSWRDVWSHWIMC
jgi:hypothetical protein